MPSKVVWDRATPATAQPSLTSSSITARPRLRAPNTTALRCLPCFSLIGSLDSVGVLAYRTPVRLGGFRYMPDLDRARTAVRRAGGPIDGRRPTGAAAPEIVPPLTPRSTPATPRRQR